MNKLRTTLLAAMSLIAAHAAHAEMSGNVVKIGVLNDQSSLYTDLAGQGSVVAAQMAVEDFGGKVNGTAIEIVSADHQNKADVGSNAAREWLDVGGGGGIVDGPESGGAPPGNAVVNEKNKVFPISC